MSAKVNIPIVEAIMELPEDGLKLQHMDENMIEHESVRAGRSFIERNTSSINDNDSHLRGSRRRGSPSYRTRSGHCGTDQKKKQYSSDYITKGRVADGSRSRPKRSHSRSSSASSSCFEEMLIDPKGHAAARSRLTSPSVTSDLTTMTASTNRSSGSSGSNSTVTPLSISRRTSHRRKKDISESVKQTELDKPVLSPPVPDAPNVFAFLETNAPCELRHKQRGTGQSAADAHEAKQLVKHSITPLQVAPDQVSSSSASSSFRGDETFSDQQQNESDRSTSPDISEAMESGDIDMTPNGQASVKLATQLAAAERWQNSHSAPNSYGTPAMQRGNFELPHMPPTELSNRYSRHTKQHSLPRAEKLPVTGYELLASRLSTSTNVDGPPPIKPMYRKFEALNHRLLLHLQDEISELEEQLHRLDNADTQSRRLNGHIVPASRRGAVHSGGELQWHKTDILGRIGYKLAQYNQTLTSFHSTLTLPPPTTSEISHYRAYLSSHQHIAEAESRFLDLSDDLVAICPASETALNTLNAPPSASSSLKTRFDTHPTSISSICSSLVTTDAVSRPEEQYLILILATILAILLPIAISGIVSGFLIRILVSAFVASGIVGAVVKVGAFRIQDLTPRDYATYLGLYGGILIFLARSV